MQADLHPAPQRPASDVSPMVGVVGLVALFGWIMLCRNWAMVAEAFDLPGPRAPLSGPYAALMAMGLAGLAMALWSVLVDRVHRNPSTGIDWSVPRPWGADIDTSITKLAGLWATWAMIGALYCLGRWYWDGQYLFAMRVIGVAALPMFIASVPYVLWIDRVLVDRHDHAWHFGAMLLGRKAWDVGEVKRHWRAWGIKGFFSAFMISILPPGFERVVTADFATLASDPVALAMILFEVLFLIDVQIGTVGYLCTLRPLDAHIRSGNPYLAGWLAALLCYPPFVFGFMANNGVIGYQFHTAEWGHWLAGHPGLLWLWGVWLVFLTAIYAWATVAFGIRFSNLTYRGVLTGGPFRFTRHPAYVSKNLFWWFSILPMLVTNGSLVDAIRNTFFLGCVSAIYYWRARTEEAHLLAEDPKYGQYHAWMAQNGLITRPLARLHLWFSRRLRGPA